MFATKKILKNLGRPQFIGNPFAASKNTRSKQERGLWGENQVIADFLKRKFRLVGHRKKIFGVEVDLLFRDLSGSLYLIEVKNIACDDRISTSLSWRQKLRLQKVMGFLCENEPKVFFQMAYVTRTAKVIIIDENIF